jgi:hypothetical protein
MELEYLNLDKEKKRRKPLFWALGTKFGPSQLFCASPIPSPLFVRPYPASGPDGQLLRALLCAARTSSVSMTNRPACL